MRTIRQAIQRITSAIVEEDSGGLPQLELASELWTLHAWSADENGMWMLQLQWSPDIISHHTEFVHTFDCCERTSSLMLSRITKVVGINRAVPTLDELFPNSEDPRRHVFRHWEEMRTSGLFDEDFRRGVLFAEYGEGDLEARKCKGPLFARGGLVWTAIIS